MLLIRKYLILYNFIKVSINMKQYTLITGATGGLGNAFCYELAKKNSPLLLTGTKQ